MDEEDIKRLNEEVDAEIAADNQKIVGQPGLQTDKIFFHDRDKKHIGIKGGGEYNPNWMDMSSYWRGTSGEEQKIPIPDIYIDYSKKRTIDDMRATGQALLGTGDEIEAFYKSYVDKNSKNYTENLNTIRSEITKYREENPGASITSEVLGGILTGPAYIGKTGLATFGRILLGGGLTGLGKADPDENLKEYNLDLELPGQTMFRLEQGFNGSLFSLPFAMLGRYLQPDAVAKIMQNKGVHITPGMMTGGEAKSLEKIFETLPGGSAIIANKAKALKTFNEVAYRELYGDINNVLKQIIKRNPVFKDGIPVYEKSVKGLKFPKIKISQKGVKEGDGFELFKTADKHIDKIYKEFHKVVKLSNKGDIENQITTKIDELLPEKSAKSMKELLNKVLYHRFTKPTNEQGPGGFVLEGNNLKEAMSVIKRMWRKENKGTGAVTELNAKAYKAVADILTKEIAKQNPKYAQQYLAFDALYPKFLTLEKAINSTKNLPGYFSPDNLIAAGKSLSGQGSKKNYALDKTFFGDYGRQGSYLGIGDDTKEMAGYYAIGLATSGGLGMASGNPFAGFAAPYVGGALYRGLARPVTGAVRQGAVPGLSPMLSDVLRERFNY